MTRTSRATFPRAIIKDRSESKTGLDKSLRKNGAGGHNWGSIAHERDLEDAALYDEDESLDEGLSSDTFSSHSESSDEKKISLPAHVTITKEEHETAKQFRKNALKNAEGLDLSAIARTSAARHI